MKGYAPALSLEEEEKKELSYQNHINQFSKSSLNMEQYL